VRICAPGVWMALATSPLVPDLVRVLHNEVSG
jgi:hypothetical protein